MTEQGKSWAWPWEEDGSHATKYVRADLPPKLVTALALPEVAALVEALRWIAENDDEGDALYHSPGPYAKRAKAALAALNRKETK